MTGSQQKKDGQAEQAEKAAASRPPAAHSERQLPPPLRSHSIAESREVSSYGVHRLSIATRLMGTFVIIACATALILSAVLLTLWAMIGIELDHYYSLLALVAGVVLAIAVATVIGFTSARGIIQPLERVTETVKELKKQNFDARTGLTGFDEIGRLGRVLDEMADAIQSVRKYERQITTDIAHELRTPLTAMQATLEAMLDGVVPTDEERLATLYSEVQRLGRLVAAQFELSRLENRSTPVNVERLELGQLMENHVNSYHMLAEEADLSLVYDSDPDIWVLGDSDLLCQAVSDLISNAFRYTAPGGSITVQVRTRLSKAVISVADTGTGIAQADLKNVFTKFWRASDDRNRMGGGMGIGLAMVKEIVMLHDGVVNVSSTLGEGSCFTITLPRDIEPIHAGGHQRPSARPMPQQAAKTSGGA
jgi:signal transduction histidine kinase